MFFLPPVATALLLATAMCHLKVLYCLLFYYCLRFCLPIPEVVVVRIFSPVTGRCQMLTIERSAHFLLRLLFCVIEGIRTCVGVSNGPKQ